MSETSLARSDLQVPSQYLFGRISAARQCPRRHSGGTALFARGEKRPATLSGKGLSMYPQGLDPPVRGSVGAHEGLRRQGGGVMAAAADRRNLSTNVEYWQAGFVGRVHIPPRLRNYEGTVHTDALKIRDDHGDVFLIWSRAIGDRTLAVVSTFTPGFCGWPRIVLVAPSGDGERTLTVHEKEGLTTGDPFDEQRQTAILVARSTALVLSGPPMPRNVVDIQAARMRRQIRGARR